MLQLLLLLSLCVLLAISKDRKELKALLEDLNRQLRVDLEDFKETFEKEFTKEMREAKANLTYMNHDYEEMKVQN